MKPAKKESPPEPAEEDEAAESRPVIPPPAPRSLWGRVMGLNTAEEMPAKQVPAWRNDLVVDMLLGDAWREGSLSKAADATLRNMPGSPEQYARWARLAFERLQFRYALDWCIKYLNKEPQDTPIDPSILDLAGLCHYHIGEYEDAVASFNRAAELDPNNPSVLINRGIALEAQGSPEEAIRDFDAALELYSKLAIAHWHKALAEMKIGNIPEAMAELLKAIQLDESYRDRARSHEAFDSVQDDPRFLVLFS
ncbi:MAG TPA: tetratricopeptide repeat protein [Candidatus Lokiarchaeia archaeon]|nr:tetratricopeptide repeat protein [Candidatus Lokiarchaeia archaeon]